MTSQHTSRFRRTLRRPPELPLEAAATRARRKVAALLAPELQARL